MTNVSTRNSLIVQLNEFKFVNPSPAERFIEKLTIADPESAEILAEDIHNHAVEIPDGDWEHIEEEAIWGLSVEPSFAREYIRGLLLLTGRVPESHSQRYIEMIRETASQGPTLARIYATHLATVVRYGDNRLLDDVLKTIDVMLGKGSYTLNAPLTMLSTFLAKGETSAIPSYLDLLKTAFSLELTYNQSQHIAYTLPKAAELFPPENRLWQTWELERVIEEDFQLVDPFLEGMEYGLKMLSKKALHRFVDLGLDLYRKKEDRGVQFLSLNSQEGRTACASLQVAVSLEEVRPQINKYLRARTGRPITVAPVSSIPGSLRKEPSRPEAVVSDHRRIYLPAEIGIFPLKSQNIQLYMLLAKLEAGTHELGTFEFDFDKATDQCRAIRPIPETLPPDRISDLDRFFRLFPAPGFAKKLFLISEHARQSRLFAARYPGMIRRALPLLRRELERAPIKPEDVLSRLYWRLVIDVKSSQDDETQEDLTAQIDQWADRFEELMETDSGVETVAVWVFEVYPEIAGSIQNPEDAAREWEPPFKRGLLTGSVSTIHPKIEEAISKIKTAVDTSGYRIYRSDLRKRIQDRDFRITPEDIQELMLHPPIPTDGDSSDIQHGPPTVEGMDLSELLMSIDSAQIYPDDGEGQVSWYREWNSTIGDYLQDHARVRDRAMGDTENRFYDNILHQRKTLVKGIRQVFELLKPEGLKILRQWTEGDAFDYRALLDYVMDRRAGRMPSDRLYIKRLKEERGIAVLILVDMSRSTANLVAGTSATVLDVEKESLVLFCEALDVLGDTFAIAGFSGTGRLGVDYYRIKDFDDPLDQAMRRKIGAMTPQRSTRMGAAIRHATTQMNRVPSRVRLLLILGDGFPNDLDYKQHYAIADTRKAVMEARSQNIHVKAMTVNIAADPKLDDLYGNHHHNVISDVRELPDKLLRVYSALTR